MRLFFIILFLLPKLITAQQADWLGDVPDSVSIKLQRLVSQRILEYRYALVPGLSKQRQSATPEGLFKSLVDSPIDSTWHLALDVNRWPTHHPRINFYMLSKKQNTFTNGKDSIASPTYDSFNAFFPHDNIFLVYYDAQTGDIEYVSGNFTKDRANMTWHEHDGENGALLFLLKTLTQFEIDPPTRILAGTSLKNANRIYDSLLLSDPTSFHLQATKSTLAASSVIIRINREWPYEKFDIVFFSNRKDLVKDENPKNLYEVKYSFNYAPGYFPSNYEQTLPAITRIDEQSLQHLQKKFGGALFLFFDGTFQGSVFQPQEIYSDPPIEPQKKKKGKKKSH